MNRRHRRREAKKGPKRSAAAPTGGPVALEGAFGTAVEHFQAGRLQQAEHVLKEMQRAQPDIADVLHLLGVIALQTGRWGTAVAHLQKAAAGIPGSAAVHNALGCALLGEGRTGEAVIVLETAVSLQPEFVDAHYNLGNALVEDGRLETAVDRYRQALSLEPGFADAHYNLGRALRRLGRLGEAVTHYERALEFAPGRADAHNGLGITLLDLGRVEAAVGHLEKAVSLDSGLAEAHANLGNALKERGQVDEAIACLETALALDPHAPGMHSNLIFCKHYSPRYGPEAILAETREWNDRHARPLAPRIRACNNDPDPRRRLRIGYVSADFRRHPVGYFCAAVLAAHNKKNVETFCYTANRAADEITERFQEHAHHWRSIAGLNDAQAAELIRTDRIDILVDLSGHSGRNRLIIFALRPAPVQATGGGIFCTSGLKAIDYLLSDGFETPHGAERFYSEDIVRLPHGYVCYRPPEYATPVQPPPSLGRGYVTFGCFNNLAKITPDVAGLWSRILDAAPGAKIMLKTGALDSATARDRFSRLFETNGIATGRLVLDGGAPHAQLLAAYADVDIALDPFPYSGGLTTLEALWMGVPVITVGGSTFAARHTISHLSNIGLTELITDSPERYVDAALQLANDPGRLQALRLELRDRMAASPVCDAARYARDLEKAFREMWKLWCAKGSR